MIEQAALNYWASPLWDHLARPLQVKVFETLYHLGHATIGDCTRIKPVNQA
jgi:hypothetical protein